MSSLPNLFQLNCRNNQLVNLDLTNKTHLNMLNCSNDSSLNLDFSNNPNLEYVCADDFQLTQVQDGTHTIQPILDNPTYFNVFHSSVSITFPAQASPYSQNFCITLNGLHPDLDINASQIDYDYTALPG